MHEPYGVEGKVCAETAQDAIVIWNESLSVWSVILGSLCCPQASVRAAIIFRDM
jgi:hypothetical protein